MNMTIVGQTVAAVLEQFGTKWPSKTIARYLLENHPQIFSSLEQARSAVRLQRGACGKNNLSRKKLNRDHGSVRDGNIPLPDPIVHGKPWNVVPITFKTALLISDIHFPFHDKQSLELSLLTGEKHGVDCVIINGDMVDFYAASKFDKNPETRNLNAEIQMGRLFLEHLRQRFPKAQIVYKEGNHEERLWRYAWTQCPDLFSVLDGSGAPMLSLKTLLDCDEYGVTVVTDKRPIRCGDHLHLLHGHEFRSPFQNPVNPARGLYLRAKCNAVCGDLHQSSNHTENGLTHTVSCWSAGCLCDLHPAYMPLNKWNLGFGIIHLDKSQWSFENKKVIKGQVVSA